MMKNAFSRFSRQTTIVLILVLMLISIFSSGCNSKKQSDQKANDTILFPIVTAKKIGFIDDKGNMIINPQYDNSSTSFSEGLCWVKSGDKYGYIDALGNYIINPQFDYAEDFHEGLALIVQKGKYGYVDKVGQIIISPQFDSASSFSGGMASVLLGKTYGYIDKTGKIVINPQFDYAGDFKDGLACINLGERFGFIDTKGQFVVNPQYSLSDHFSDGLAVVSLGNDSDIGYIDTNGKLVITPQFTYGTFFSDGLASVQIGKKWGYIDKSGKIVINPQFDLAYPFSENIAQVEIEKKWGYIDNTGKYLINPQYDGADDFKNGLACTYTYNPSKQTMTMSYIDTTGKAIWTMELNKADLVELGSHTTSSGPIDTSTYIGSWGSENEHAGANLGYDMLELSIDKIVDGMIKGSIDTFSYRVSVPIVFQGKLSDNTVKFDFIDEMDNPGTCVLTLEENALIADIQMTKNSQKVTEKVVFNKRLGDVGSYE